MVHRTRPIAIVVACAALGIACDDGGATSPTTPPPATTAQNPCPPGRASLARLDGSPSDKASQPTRVDPRGTLGDILWRHRAAQGRAVPLAVAAPTAAADVGEIAVLQDEGDLVAPPNAFDLQG